MIFYEVDTDNYVVKVFNEEIYDLDIFNIDEVEDFIKNIFKNFVKTYKLKGDVLLNIYIDLYYGIIVEVKKEDSFYDSDEIDARVVFHLNNAFLYEVDYFYILDNTSIKNANVYFYNNKFYLELTDEISISDKYKLSEACDIIWDDRSFEIINKAIKLKLAS